MNVRLPSVCRYHLPAGETAAGAQMLRSGRAGVNLVGTVWVTGIRLPSAMTQRAAPNCPHRGETERPRPHGQRNIPGWRWYPQLLSFGGELCGTDGGIAGHPPANSLGQEGRPVSFTGQEGNTLPGLAFRLPAYGS